jgi:GT2 family glycosyltransferase
MIDTVYVLLPVHNRRETTLRFIGCLRAQTYPRVRLLVIDDGSTDGTAEAVLKAYPEADVIRGSGAWWWAGCLQHGLDWLAARRVTDSDIVLIANDDTTFGRDYIERAVAFLAAHTRCLLLSRSRDAVTGEVRETGVHADFLRFRFPVARRSEEINCLSSRGLFMRWADAREIGGFHPRMLPHYWSDLEYTLRARRHGFTCATDASVLLDADAKATGFHHLDHLTGPTFIRRLFSVRTPVNPIYTSGFVLLAAPLPLLLPNLIRVWLAAAAKIVWQGVLRRPRGRGTGSHEVADPRGRQQTGGES